jgi:hypothetical protein
MCATYIFHVAQSLLFGWLLGELAADVVFYWIAGVSYEFRKRAVEDKPLIHKEVV